MFVKDLVFGVNVVAGARFPRPNSDETVIINNATQLAAYTATVQRYCYVEFAGNKTYNIPHLDAGRKEAMALKMRALQVK